MMRFVIIITIAALISCKDGKHKRYEKFVQEADRFKVFYNATNKTVTVPEHSTENFKKILTRNVEPEMQRKFMADVRIDIFTGGKRTAFLMITNRGTNPFVNFGSNGMSFCFPLTYGMGQAVENLYANASR